MNVANEPRAMEVRFRFHTDVGRISTAVDRIMRLVELAGCVSDARFEVELALREALVNAMVHGNRMDPEKCVHVRCRCEPGNGVSIVVGDEGQGFDPIGVPDPTTAEGIRSAHGRGIFMMRSYMDEVSFEKGGTEVHLRKRAGHRSRRSSPRWSDQARNHSFTGADHTARYVQGSRLVRKRGSCNEGSHGASDHTGCTPQGGC